MHPVIGPSEIVGRGRSHELGIGLCGFESLGPLCGSPQLLSHWSPARCTQTVCWLLCMFSGCLMQEANEVVDRHPCVRRDLFEGHYGLQDALHQMEEEEKKHRLAVAAAKAATGRKDGVELRVSKLVLVIWVDGCEILQEGSSQDSPGNLAIFPWTGQSRKHTFDHVRCSLPPLLQGSPQFRSDAKFANARAH